MGDCCGLMRSVSSKAAELDILMTIQFTRDHRYQYLTAGPCISISRAFPSQLHTLGEPSGRISQAIAAPRSYRPSLQAFQPQLPIYLN